MSTNANIKASISINNSFTRHLLKLLAPEVKAINPKLNVFRGAEWVYKTGRNDWEFHGPNKFYWHGRADNAYDARYKGWTAWLRQQKRAGAAERSELKDKERAALDQLAEDLVTIRSKVEGFTEQHGAPLKHAHYKALTAASAALTTAVSRITDVTGGDAA